jgi:hypothetical protein
MAGPEYLTTAEVASLLGYTGDAAGGSARKAMRRLGIQPKNRQAGRGGQNLYNAAEVSAAIAGMPGRGKVTGIRGNLRGD